MTQTKNVGRFEQLMLTVIGTITGAYFIEGFASYMFEVPMEIAAVFIVAVVGYFINRSILVFERYMDNQIILKRLESERQFAGETRRENRPGETPSLDSGSGEDTGFVP